MKFKLEKKIKIVNDLITFFHIHGNSNIHIDMSSDNTYSYITISGKVKSISEEEIQSFSTILNAPRCLEIEQYYWNLGGQSESDCELSLISSMVDSAEISLVDEVLTIKLIRKEI